MLIYGYGVGMTLGLALRWLVGDSFVLVAMFTTLLHLLVLPALVLLPLAVVLRRPRVALTLVPSLAVFAFTYVPLFLPHTIKVPANAPTFTVLTFNVHGENVISAAALEQVIRDANPDVVGIQEVSPALADYFKTHLSDVYPYQAMHPQQGYRITYGMGFLSRYPLLADDYWTNFRGHQRVEFQVNGVPITYFNTHPRNPFSFRIFNIGARQQEIDDILHRAARETNRVVIAGDFNTTDQTDAYAAITAKYADSYRQAGWGAGFTFMDPWLGVLGARLDYVFHGSGLQAVTAEAWRANGGSNHTPVRVTLAVVDAATP